MLRFRTTDANLAGLSPAKDFAVKHRQHCRRWCFPTSCFGALMTVLGQQEHVRFSSISVAEHTPSTLNLHTSSSSPASSKGALQHLANNTYRALLNPRRHYLYTIHCKKCMMTRLPFLSCVMPHCWEFAWTLKTICF